jgi:hypothetical protein
MFVQVLKALRKIEREYEGVGSTGCVVLEIRGGHGTVAAPIRHSASGLGDTRIRRCSPSATLERGAEVSADRLQGAAHGAIRLAASKQGRDRPREILPRLGRRFPFLFKLIFPNVGPRRRHAPDRVLQFRLLSRFH